jgi:NifU-like protein involved in Fe-S cluster formation
MSDPLYAKDVLRLAANATGAGKLAPCDAQGVAHNPACGDRVAVTLRLDAAGRITALAHETQACVLAQASVSILGAGLGGTNRADVEALRESVAAMLRDGTGAPPGFTAYAALTGAALYRGRHACVLLPIDAVLDALEHDPITLNRIML